MEIKLYSNLPNHLKILKNIQPFRRKLKSVFLAMIFCAVDEYVLQVLIITNVCMIWGLILRNELLMC